jgi:hypothetical protein
VPSVPTSNNKKPQTQLEDRLKAQEKRYKEEAAKFKTMAQKHGTVYGNKRAADAKGETRAEMTWLKDQVQKKDEEVGLWSLGGWLVG